MATNKVYTRANKTTVIWIETELSFFITQGGWVNVSQFGLAVRH